MGAYTIWSKWYLADEFVGGQTWASLYIPTTQAGVHQKCDKQKTPT